MRWAKLLLSSSLIVLPGCIDALVNTSQPSKSMRNAAQYVRTHKGEGTRQTVQGAYADVYEAFAGMLEKTKIYTVSREDHQIIAVYANTEQLDMAIGVYFLPGPSKDQTDAQVLAASPWLTAATARQSEGATIKAAADQVELVQARRRPQSGGAVATGPAPAAAAIASPRPARTMAVLELHNKLKERKEALDLAYFSDQIRAAALKEDPSLNLITRENLLVLLQASGKNVADCEGECEVDTGRRVGADVVISGEGLRIGSIYKLNLKLHDTRSGRLLSGSTASGRTVEDLDADVARAVRELAQPLH